ncbi:DgyrCDS13620 [Dimorphilus gyrociliatus]|uniref:DgyrCDS13620 n=1 Tax=Dimorphilus gyrociliatus TaxID=2664684 RepID=A0A7I8WB74_9ANNE|nr:DgyrCDS13620 [Dimorphilus gyrociliatus]
MSEKLVFLLLLIATVTLVWGTSSDQRLAELRAKQGLRSKLVIGHGLLDPDKIGKRRMVFRRFKSVPKYNYEEPEKPRYKSDKTEK